MPPNPTTERPKTTEKVKITVLLSSSDVQELEQMAAQEQSSVTEALRRCIRTTSMLRREMSLGSQLVLKRKGERLERELMLI
jgi:hypothetical protein